MSSDRLFTPWSPSQRDMRMTACSNGQSDFRVTTLAMSFEPSDFGGLTKRKISLAMTNRMLSKSTTKIRPDLDFRTSLYPPRKKSYLLNSYTDVTDLRVGPAPVMTGGVQSSLQPIGQLRKIIFNKENTDKDGSELSSLDTQPLYTDRAAMVIQFGHSSTLKLSANDLDRGIDSDKLRRNFKVTKKGVQGFIRRKLHLGMRPGDVVLMKEARYDNAGGKYNLMHETQNKKQRLPRGIILDRSRRPTDSDDQSQTAEIMQKEAEYGELFSNSVRYELREIKTIDEDFRSTTKPSQTYYDSLKHLRGLDLHKSPSLTEDDIQHHRKDLEYILEDFSAIDSMPIDNKVAVFANVIANWLEKNIKNQPPETSNPTHTVNHTSNHTTTNRSNPRMSKVMSNFFRLIDKSLKSFESGGIEDTLGQLPFFFDICDKLILQEINAEKNSDTEESSKALSEVCAGMNYLIRSALGILFRIPEDYLTNLVKGYLQNLFQVFYDLTELPTDLWIPRLQHIGYQMLTMPENIDGLFSIGKFLNHCLLSDQFFGFFERFYTCILSLIIKSEFFTTRDLYIWQFILDLYSVHFIFAKSLYLNMMCRRVMKQLHNVTPDNMLLRYIALVSHIPHGHLVYHDIRHSLSFNNVQISKCYQNAAMYSRGLVVKLSKAIVKKVLVTMFTFIDERYNNENEQSAVISQVSNWMKVIAYYINYSKHYGNQYDKVLKVFSAFRLNFNELLFRMKSRKTTNSNKDDASNCWRLILEACDGLENQICSPVQSPGRKKPKQSMFNFKLKR